MSTAAGTASPRPFAERGSAGDVEERTRREAYLRAFEKALRATSRPWAPWYAIPADDKDFARLQVAEIVAATLGGLGLRWPKVAEEDRARFDELRLRLEEEVAHGELVV